MFFTARVGATTVVVAGLALCMLRPTKACQDFRCWSTNICSEESECATAPSCSADAVTFDSDTIQVAGDRCKVTLEDLHQYLPDSVSKEDTVYTLNHKLLITNGCVLEVHGAETATAGASVSLLQLKVRVWCARIEPKIAPGS